MRNVTKRFTEVDAMDDILLLVCLLLFGLTCGTVILGVNALYKIRDAVELLTVNLLDLLAEDENG